MWVRAPMCVCACEHARMCVSACIYKITHALYNVCRVMHTHNFGNIQVLMHACVFVCWSTCVSVCIYALILRVNVCMDVCVCVQARSCLDACLRVLTGICISMQKHVCVLVSDSASSTDWVRVRVCVPEWAFFCVSSSACTPASKLVRAYAYVSVSMHAYANLYVLLWQCVTVCICDYAWTCVRILKRACAQKWVCARVWKRTHSCAYVNGCVYVCLYVRMSFFSVYVWWGAPACRHTCMTAYANACLCKRMQTSVRVKAYANSCVCMARGVCVRTHESAGECTRMKAQVYAHVYEHSCACASAYANATVNARTRNCECNSECTNASVCMRLCHVKGHVHTNKHIQEQISASTRVCKAFSVLLKD